MAFRRVEPLVGKCNYCGKSIDVVKTGVVWDRDKKEYHPDCNAEMRRKGIWKGSSG